MSLSRDQSGKRLYNENDTDDLEAENLPLHPGRVSRSSTLEDMTEENLNINLATRGVLEPCKRSSTMNSATFENRPRIVKRNEVVDVNIEMQSRNESLNSPSSVKCFGLIKDSRLSQTNSSSNSLCGPSPRKSMRWICIFVFVWITFMVVINMQKKLSALEHELDYVTKEIKSMKKNHHNFKKVLTNLRDIDKPNVEGVNVDVPRTFKSKQESSKKSAIYEEEWPLNSLTSQTNKTLTTKRPLTTSSSSLSDNGKKEITSDSNECTTEDGVKCIFPFYYDGERTTACRQTWRDIKPWCATRVDENDAFIDDSSAWDWCASTCPITK